MSVACCTGENVSYAADVHRSEEDTRVACRIIAIAVIRRNRRLTVRPAMTGITSVRNISCWKSIIAGYTVVTADTCRSSSVGCSGRSAATAKSGDRQIRDLLRSNFPKNLSFSWSTTATATFTPSWKRLRRLCRQKRTSAVRLG